MSRKPLEALGIGFGLWVAGALAIFLVGGLRDFALAAPWVVLLLTPPVVVVLTTLHLRDVEPAEQVTTALQLSVLITAVQLPLDGVLFLGMFRLGWPALTQASTESLLIALMIGYFWMLTVPWIVGLRAAR